MTRDQIFEELKRTMSETFEIDPSAITTEARLVDDLDLDSIDGVDMAVRIQDLTGKRVDEKDLRSLQTVGNVLDLIENMLLD